MLPFYFLVQRQLPRLRLDAGSLTAHDGRIWLLARKKVVKWRAGDVDKRWRPANRRARPAVRFVGGRLDKPS